MTRAEMKSLAKEQIKGNIGKLFAVMLIIVLITAACSIIPVVGTFIVAQAFVVSLCIIYLKLAKKEEMR